MDFHTNNILIIDEKYNDFFMAALKNTDIRINDGLHVNPSFIYAVFLWPYFKEMEETSSDVKDFDSIFRRVIESQAKYISIPDFFKSTIFFSLLANIAFINLWPCILCSL